MIMERYEKHKKTRRKELITMLQGHLKLKNEKHLP